MVEDIEGIHLISVENGDHSLNDYLIK